MKKAWKTHPVKLKFTYQEQKDYESIESEIAGLEDLKARIEAQKLRIPVR